MTGALREIPADKLLEAVRRHEANARENPEPLKGGPQPPDNGGMDTTSRIDKLEERLTRMEEALSYVVHEVRQFKWWVVGQIVALFLAVIGTGVAIQQMTVATFQGAAQVAKDSAPPAAQPQQPAPIIINVPPAQQPAAPPARSK